MAENTTPFLNLQTDFAFKRLFGSLSNKGILIRFLNALFEGKLTVTDVVYHDKEILPSKEKGKRLIYDVYCTTDIRRADSPFFTAQQLKDKKGDTDNEHHFILEMQNSYIPPFEERMTYYAAKMVAEQGKSGWNYELDPVIAIAVTDFNLGEMSKKLVRDVMLLDRESGEALTEKVHIFFCSLPEVPKQWEDCRTEIERLLFLIKNMGNMDSTSLAYREGNYNEIFEASRSGNLDKSELIAYSESLDRLRDIRASIDYAAEKAAEEEGERQRIKERQQAIRIMLSLGITPEVIAEKYDISPEEVIAIANAD